MLPSLVIPLLLLAFCSGEPDTKKLQTADQSGIRVSDHAVREKRMVLGLAGRIKRLLDWAIPVESTTAVREYVRLGSFRKASMDFSAVRPHKMKFSPNKPNAVFEKEGEIGDQLLVLSNGGRTGRPTIEFRNRKEIVGNDDVTDRITYVDEIP